MFEEKLSRRNFLKLTAALAATLGLPWPEVAEAESVPPPVPDDLADLEQFEEYLAEEVQPLPPPVEVPDWPWPPMQPQTSRIFGRGGLFEVDSKQVELLEFVLTIGNDSLGHTESSLTVSYFSRDQNGRRLPDLFFGPTGQDLYPVTLFIPNGPTLQARGIFDVIGSDFIYDGSPVIVSGEMTLIDCILHET